MDPTLLIHWLFSCLALLIMSGRLIWRRASGQSFVLGDYLTMAAGVCALTRLGLIHVVLTWGTNNMTDQYRNTHHFTSRELYQREIGSKLSIVNRLFYNSYLWLQKLVLLDLDRRLIIDLPYEKLIVYSYLFVFFGSYVVVQVVTFSECNPLHLYWQVLPDPGLCATAHLQLIVLGILNIVTDFMLLVLPIPIVFRLRAPFRRKAQLSALFALGIFIILITIIRLPINSKNKFSQVNRTTWASVELLTSAIVVNATTLWGLWNKRRRERSEKERRNKVYDYDGSDHQAHIETIGGSSGSYQMSAKKKPTGGIMQTREVIVSEYRETRHSGDYYQLPEDNEPVSRVTTTKKEDTT